MFDKNLTRETIIQSLEPVISVFEETVVPKEVELLANNTYAPDYAWMYSFEKKLKYRIEDVLGRKLGVTRERELFGAGGAISEGLSNAFIHGHKKDTERPIAIWTCVSKQGLGVSITDEGAGFDFDRIMQRFKSKKSFFHVAGNGFSLYYKSTVCSASFRERGRQLCLLYPLKLPET